jgi:hypothetical protein
MGCNDKATACTHGCSVLHALHPFRNKENKAWRNPNRYTPQHGLPLVEGHVPHRVLVHVGFADDNGTC